MYLNKMKAINNLDYCDYGFVESMIAKKWDEDSPLEPFGTNKNKLKSKNKRYGKKSKKS